MYNSGDLSYSRVEVAADLVARWGEIPSLCSEQARQSRAFSDTE